MQGLWASWAFRSYVQNTGEDVNVIDDENVTEDNQFDEEIFVLGKQDATVSLSISGK